MGQTLPPITVSDWNDLLSKLESYKSANEITSPEPGYSRKNTLLYRGHGNKEWQLKTTLERVDSEAFDVTSYVIDVSEMSHEIGAQIERQWNLPTVPELLEILKTSDSFRCHVPIYEYLVFLRHHGYPSPLLDWSTSPFIALFFALSDAIELKTDAALFAYNEREEGVKGGVGGNPAIHVMGPYTEADERHFIQRSWYTVAAKWDYSRKSHVFVSHENVFSSTYSGNKQDVLQKFIIPNHVAKVGLRSLDEHNISFHSLYGGIDALIKSFRMKKFILK